VSTHRVISLADALRAASELGPLDGEARDCLLEMMGVAHAAAAAPAPAAIGVWKPSSTEASARPDRPPLTVRPPAPLEPSPLVPAGAVGRERRARTSVTQTRLESQQPPLPAWLLAPGAALEPAAPESSVPKAPEPLFGQRTGRAILTAALATIVHEGEIDIERLVPVFGEGRTLDTVPRQAMATLRRGAQVLVDLGAGLDPYRGDVDQLLDGFDRVLADDRLQTFFFAGCPSRGVYTATDPDSREWTPPPPGVPTVVVTDLGIGGALVDDDRASAIEWLDFARTVRASAGSPSGGPGVIRSSRLSAA